MPVAPRVSVVIPHLNEPDNLRRCLESLEAQRAADVPFEVIVVDNGSYQLPEDACSAIPGVKLEVERIPGPGPARNHGAKVAQADLLAFIDADCVALPGWVRAIVEFADRNPGVDVIGGDIGILLADAARPTAVEAYESIFSYRARLYVERHGYAATGNMAVRTRVFRAVGPFGGISVMEDTEWGHRATRQGFRIAYLPEARILTPSCRSFSELAVRWDRHVAHEFREVGYRPTAMVRWLVRSAVIAVSPPLEIFRILSSDRVVGMRARLLALACLARIRLHRAKLMLELVIRDRSNTMVVKWNREKS